MSVASISVNNLAARFIPDDARFREIVSKSTIPTRENYGRCGASIYSAERISTNRLTVRWNS